MSSALSPFCDGPTVVDHFISECAWVDTCMHVCACIPKIGSVHVHVHVHV